MRRQLLPRGIRHVLKVRMPALSMRTDLSRLRLLIERENEKQDWTTWTITERLFTE